MVDYSFVNDAMRLILGGINRMLNSTHDNSESIVKAFNENQEMLSAKRSEAYKSLSSCLAEQHNKVEDSKFPSCLQNADRGLREYITFFANNYKEAEGYYKDLLKNEGQSTDILALHEVAMGLLNRLDNTVMSKVFRYKIFKSYGEYITYDDTELEPTAQNISSIIEQNIQVMFLISRDFYTHILGHKAFTSDERVLLMDRLQTYVDYQALKYLHDSLDRGLDSPVLAKIHHSIFSTIIQNEKRGIDKCATSHNYKNFESEYLSLVAQTTQEAIDYICVLDAALGIRNSYRTRDDSMSRYEKMLDIHHKPEDINVYLDSYTLRCKSLLKDSFL